MVTALTLVKNEIQFLSKYFQCEHTDGFVCVVSSVGRWKIKDFDQQ